MALNEDLASLALLFVDNDRGVLWAVWRHWMTDTTRRRVTNFTHGNFGEWIRDASVDIREYQGNWIDGPEVAEQIADLAAEFRPESIGVDSFRSREMHQLLGEDGYGYNVELLRSTGRSMQAATERVSAEVAARRLLHNGDQVARWAASNCEVHYDPSGFPKIRKVGGEPQSPVKIDPIDALLYACDRMLAWERGRRSADSGSVARPPLRHRTLPSGREDEEGRTAGGRLPVMALLVSDPNRIDRWIQRHGSVIQLVSVAVFALSCLVAAFAGAVSMGPWALLLLPATAVPGAVMSFWVHLLGDEDDGDNPK